MEQWIKSLVEALLAALGLPQVGLSAVFIVSFVSATLLPLGSEPVVYGYVRLEPGLFWPAILVATLGNTLGGVVSYFMGLGARQAYARVRRTRGRSGRLAASGARGTAPKAPGRVGGRWHELVDKWARRFGPAALLLSWLPVVGDPLCAVAGWLRLSFWPSVLFMAIGKFFRYLVMTGLLMWVFPVGS